MSFHQSSLSSLDPIPSNWLDIPSAQASFNVGSLPQGIAAIEYEVDLGHAVSFELSAADYNFAFRRVAG